MSHAAADSRLLDVPVPRALLRLALPVLASQFLRLAFQWVDAVWVRGLGVEATAAVTTSVFVLWCVYALNDVFGAGLSAYVSQLIGAGERARAGVAVLKALVASAVVGVLAAALGLAAARPLFALMDPAGSVVEAGATYLRIVLLGAPFLLCASTCEIAMRASGDTRTPFVVDVASISLNAALAPLFIYGWGPVPRLGVAGAAWATVLSQAVMLGWYVLLLVRRHPSLPLARRAAGVPVRIAGLARVGVPAALIGMLFSVVYVAFVRAASPLGGAAVAIIGVANRIEALQFILSMSIGLAGSSLLGQALGAGRESRALEVLRTAQRWALGLSSVLTFVLLLFPAALLTLFTRDPGLLEVGVPYLRVLSLAVIATGLEIATAETIMGSGHTREISLIFTVFSLVRIPLAFVVPHWGGAGVMGIAWLITVTCVLRTVVMLVWAAKGTWRGGLARELHGTSAAVSPSGPSPAG
ncbi:MAG: MATE family efflux transporter [Candidatus Eisenbacteria bacterium]